MLKRVGKGIENIAEIKGYINACCKLGLSVKSIHDEICVVYGDKQMSFSTGGLQNSVPVRNLTLIRSSQLLRNMHISLSDRWHQMINLGLASVHFILKKNS